MMRNLNISLWIAAGFGLLVLPGESAAFPLNDGMEANQVEGQSDFSTGFVDFTTDPDFFGARAASARDLFVAGDVDYDESNERLFVADIHNHRFLVFDLALGMSNYQSAAFVMGQPDFSTGGADPSNPYGNADTLNATYGCTTVPNACGVGRAYAVAYDGNNQRLFGADPDNQRILVWELASGIANGMAAGSVLGQPSFITETKRTVCGGGSAGAVGPCGLADPSDVDYDSAANRLFVADAGNNRVLVFDLSAGLTDGMAATAVLGQPDMTTSTANTACGGGSAGSTNACGMSGPGSLSYDEVSRTLFVADYGANRVLVFDLSSGVTDGMAASHVLGQDDFTSSSPNASCSGTAGTTTSTNACGLGHWGVFVEAGGDGYLYVSDGANQRVLAFDTSPIADGAAAISVIGQSDFSTGFDPADAAWGGSTARVGLISPLGLSHDAINDRVYVADGGNHRVVSFGSNVGGEAVLIEGDADGSTTTENPDGSTDVDVTGDDGSNYTITFPPGTTGEGGGDITITVDNPGSPDAPSVHVSADLPPGMTKSISMSRGAGNHACIIDQADAEFITAASCGPAFRHQLPTAGTCVTVTVVGDPGDNPSDPSDPDGTHDVELCLSADGGVVTINGLLHSYVAMQVAREHDDDDGELGPDSPSELGGAGCSSAGDASTGGAALILIALLFAMSPRRRYVRVVRRRRRR